MPIILMFNVRSNDAIKHKKVLLICLCIWLFQQKPYAQELGYNIGMNKLGINPELFQPMYGFSIGLKVNHYFALETNLVYNQRSKNKSVQSDYFSFMAVPKVGYFNKKIGVFYAPAILLNPTLDHSNNENHTYISTLQTIGAEYKFTPKLIIDVKVGYDFGLTGGYFNQGVYQKYSGPCVLAGMKVNFNCK